MVTSCTVSRTGFSLPHGAGKRVDEILMAGEKVQWNANLQACLDEIEEIYVIYFGDRYSMQ